MVLVPGSSSGGGEKGSDSGHILEVQPTRFSDRWGIRCEGKRNQEHLNEGLVGHWRWRRLQGEQVWKEAGEQEEHKTAVGSRGQGLLSPTLNCAGPSSVREARGTFCLQEKP